MVAQRFGSGRKTGRNIDMTIPSHELKTAPMAEFEPGYVKLLRTGEFQARIDAAYKLLSRCEVCAWHCRVDRRKGQTGVCNTGLLAKVSSFGPHFGEEAPLRGWRGSGTIFFAQCNLRCQFCQNFEISQQETGTERSPEELAAIMLRLQEMGCHNINLVSPSHVAPQIMAAVFIAAQAGLRLPLVYNSGGYDSLAMLYLLDGVIDIYMPDMKFADERLAKRYSKVPRYPQVNRAAVKEMHRQVGDLVLDEQGLAIRGLLVRHLVMPNRLAGTEAIMRFLAEEISPHTYVYIMPQFHPYYHADHFPELNRPITREEFEEAMEAAKQAGLYRFDRRYVH